MFIHLDADLANVGPALHVVEGGQDLLAREREHLVHGRHDLLGRDEAHKLLQQLLAADPDPTHDHARLYQEGAHVRHVFLLGVGQEADDRDGSAGCGGADALRDGAGAAVLEHKVHAPAVRDLAHSRGPVRRRLVVDHVVRAVLGLHELELLVGRRRDDGDCASGLGDLQTHDGQAACAQEEHRLAGLELRAAEKRVPGRETGALETDEIPAIVDDYRKCTVRAKRPGFNGVEIHASSGYLIDQFLQSWTNLRTDKYGGSFENRYRFLEEIVEAVETVYPVNRIGVRMAPNGDYGGMGSPDNHEIFTYVMQRLSEHKLTYLAMLDGFGFGYSDKSRLLTVFDAKTAFNGVVIASNSYARDTAEGVIRSGAADLVGFGCLFIANPDLAERFQNDWPLNADVPYEHYWDAHKGDEGYNDLYLSYEESQA